MSPDDGPGAEGDLEAAALVFVCFSAAFLEGPIMQRLISSRFCFTGPRPMPSQSEAVSTPAGQVCRPPATLGNAV